MPGLVALCLGYVFSQFFRAFLAVLTPDLVNDLGMTVTELAYASGAWFVAFALFQFPVGMLLDTIGPKRTAGYIFTLFAGGGAFLFALANSPLMIIIAMALIGIGCSPALMAPFYIFARNYSPAKFATLSATFVAIGSLGNIAGSEPLAAAAQSFGWRETSLVLAAVAVIVGVAAFVLTKDPEKLEQNSGNDGFVNIVLIRSLWPIFPMTVMGYTVFAGLRGLWIAPYFADTYALDALQVGRVTLFMSIAGALGMLCYGPLDRIFNSRKWVIFAGNCAVLTCCIVLASGAPQQEIWATILFVLIGFFGATYAVQIAHGKSFVPAHLMGRGVTFLNFCSIGGAGLFQWMSGWVVENSVDPSTPQAEYQALFLFYAVLMGLAIFVYLFSKDAKP